MLRPKPHAAPTDPNANARCQRCLQTGHWTFDCKNEPTYRPRPTRSALLANPTLKLPENTIPVDDFNTTVEDKENEQSEEGEGRESSTEGGSSPYSSASSDFSSQDEKEEEEEKDRLCDDAPSSSSFSDDKDDLETGDLADTRPKRVKE